MSTRIGGVVMAILVSTLLACGSSTTASPGAGATPSSAGATSASPSASASAAVSQSPSASPSPTVKPTPTPSPTPSPSPSPVSVTVGGSVYFSGFNITLVSATYDPVKRNLAIEGEWENLAAIPHDMYKELGLITLNTGGAFVPLGMVVASSVVPPLSKVRATLTARMSADFDMSTAVLTFGGPTQHNGTIPLTAGATGTSEHPIDVPLTGKIKIGPYVTVTILKMQLVPATCSGTTDRLAFGPAKAVDMSLVLSVDMTNPNGTNDTVLTTYILAPDGTTSPGTPAGRYLAPHQTVRSESLCYIVPAPGTGAYTLTGTTTRWTGKLNYKFTIQ